MYLGHPYESMYVLSILLAPLHQLLDVLAMLAAHRKKILNTAVGEFKVHRKSFETFVDIHNYPADGRISILPPRIR